MTTTNSKMPHCNFEPPGYDGPTKATVLETRQRYVNPGVYTLYKEPLMIVAGHMQWLFDEKGQRYLDLLGGVCTVSVGHCHPKVIAKTQAQVEKLQHTTTLYLNPWLGELCKKIASKMPEGLECTYLVNSGSEANDLAMLMARLYTGNYDILAVRHGYHGGVSSCIGLTSHCTWKFPVPQTNGVHHVVMPDPYRSPFTGGEEEITSKSVEDIRQTVRLSTCGKVAAFIAEPILGVGGMMTGRNGYLKRAYEVVREYGGLCIADEVQTGFGRTGENYWGFQNFDAKPDIVTMAKSLGNGIPVAAVTTRREIAETLKQRTHFNTFGGNPVSAAQALATLEVIDEEGLQANAKKVGKRLKDGLLGLMETFPIIGDVRGQGLMIGLELVKDRKTKEPATDAALALFEYAKEQSILLGKGGHYGNVIRIQPPMCVTEADVDFALTVIKQGLGKI